MSRGGLLFDLDGTLVDTDHLHHAAFEDLLAPFGRSLTFENYKAHVMGHPNAEIMAYLLPDHPDRHADLANAKEKAYRAQLGSDLTPIAGIGAVLDWAASEDVAVAVVTNAPRANAERVLGASGLEAYFDVVVIGDECARPKPDPLPYQEAMRRLGITPSQALAFEDSRSGMRAARGSGARCYGLTTGLSADELLQAGAHETIADYTDPDLWAALHNLKARLA